jgi:hypothetical protein
VILDSPVSITQFFSTFVFFRGRVVGPALNPKPGGPGYPILSGSSPLTCLAWEALPVAYATASIALGFMWPRKPHHYVKVGIPSGGLFQLALLFVLCRIFLSFALYDTFSFLTQSMQFMFSVLLWDHISTLPRCFWCIFLSVQVSASHENVLQM